MVLADLDAEQRRPGEPVALDEVLDTDREVVPREVVVEQVDGDGDRTLRMRRPPVAGTTRRFDHHRPAEADQQGAVVLLDEEVSGGEQPTAGVVPPQERFDLHRPTGAQLEDRLVPADQLTAVERTLELRFGDDRGRDAVHEQHPPTGPLPASGDRRDGRCA